MEHCKVFILKNISLLAWTEPNVSDILCCILKKGNSSRNVQTNKWTLKAQMFFKSNSTCTVHENATVNQVIEIVSSFYSPWSRYNEELYHLYDETDLVTTVRITRLRWTGHIVRMQDNLPCKKITLDKSEGRKRVGRPDLRWMDGVMRDAERLGVRNWKSKAKDRDGWRRLLESAKTLHGL